MLNKGDRKTKHLTENRRLWRVETPILIYDSRKGVWIEFEYLPNASDDRQGANVRVDPTEQDNTIVDRKCRATIRVCIYLYFERILVQKLLVRSKFGLVVGVPVISPRSSVHPSRILPIRGQPFFFFFFESYGPRFRY